MYTWRKLTPAQREATLRSRRQCGYPWHGQPHFEYDLPHFFHLSAACYQHQALIGRSSERMAEFEAELLTGLRDGGNEIRAWCVLPNHWHALAKTPDLKALAKRVGRVHGRTSREWNRDENTQGRTCWFGCSDRRIRSEAHFWATMNYIHHNPVHHGYADRWQDWPYSSAMDWIAGVGEGEARRVWQDYPILDYGKGWDDPDM